jgi:hypothetical protein
LPFAVMEVLQRPARFARRCDNTEESAQLYSNAVNSMDRPCALLIDLSLHQAPLLVLWSLGLACSFPSTPEIGS